MNNVIDITQRIARETVLEYMRRLPRGELTPDNKKHIMKIIARNRRLNNPKASG